MSTLTMEAVDNKPLVVAKADEVKEIVASQIAVDSSEIEGKADEYVSKIIALSNDPSTAVDAIDNIGVQVQKEAQQKSEMLKRPIKDLYNVDKESKGSDVGDGLLQLRHELQAIDPNKFDLSDPGFFTKTLSLLPFIGNPLQKYFEKYEQSETVIDSIFHSIRNGQKALQRDNTILREDQKKLRESTIKLNKTIALTNAMDVKFESAANEHMDNPELQSFIKEEILFPLRQKSQDLYQQLLVCQQGIASYELIIRNNKELIRAVNRALNVSGTALNIAVATKLALNEQKRNIKKIDALNETTENLLVQNAKDIKTQGVEIHKRATTSQLDTEKLKQAWTDIYEAIDDVSTFKQEALISMKDTIMGYQEFAQKGLAQIEKLEKGNSVSGALQIEVE